MASEVYVVHHHGAQMVVSVRVTMGSERFVPETLH